MSKEYNDRGLPNVTVLIPVRNGEDFLSAAIDSVLTQTYGHFRLVISDNNSTDGTPRVIERYLSDERVSVFRHDHDLGMVGNMNFCLDSVQTEFYMILCHDDYFYRNDVIERSVAVLKEMPDVGVVSSSMAYVDSRARLIAKRHLGSNFATSTRALGKKSLIQCRNLIGWPLLVRSALARGKRFDANVPYMIDVDLSLGLGLDVKIFHFREPMLANRFHERNATFSLFRKSFPQFRLLEEKHGLILTRGERALQKLYFFLATAQKMLFQHYLRWRS